jgi:predicted lipoprotein with Yx(FWY)xxD motif
VRGPVTAVGVTGTFGTFGTIKRSDGSTQATFDGHPLYTFVGDTAPRQAKGNGLNAAGGLWHEITTSGTAARPRPTRRPAPAAATATEPDRGKPSTTTERTEAMTRRETTTRQANLTAAARAGQGHAASAAGWPALLARVAGAGLLIAAGAIHLDLYLTGYRTIPTIGWLFLLQVIAAFGLGLAVLAIPARLVLASRLAAAAGAVFALATLGGYLLSVWTGLFGFTEVRTTAGIVAGVVEVAAFAVLAALALAAARFPAWISPAITRAAATTAAALTVAALVLLGVAEAGASSPAPAADTGTGAGLTTTTIAGTTVLTNASGFTLYSFARTPRPRRHATAAAPRTGLR